MTFQFGLPLTAVSVAMFFWKPGQLITRIVIAIVFMCFSGLEIQQAHGVVELHFGIFVLLAFLVDYRDWRVIVIAASAITLLHILFNYLQGNGYPVYVLQQAPPGGWY